jgi:hypothetical protein
MSTELNRFQTLLNKALDNILTDAEQIEFNGLLASSNEYIEEWNSLKHIKEITKIMKLKNPPEEVWDKYWLGIYSRLERGIAWILISIGAIVILIFGGFNAVESIIYDPTLAWFLKAAILMVITGGVFLFVSVVRERIFLRKTDKYKEIIR